MAFVGRVLRKLGKIFTGLSEKYTEPFPLSIQAIRVQPWFEVNGDSTLRLNYDLNSNSLVVDLGGYEGQWSSDIFAKYCCEVMVFEPYMVYADAIKNRFSKNPKIKVFPFGLSKENQDLNLNIADNSSSTFKSNSEGATAPIKLKKAVDFFKENNVSSIDLLKINIEGGEYDLLEHLIDTNYIKEIKNIQVQFHDFVPNAELRMKNLQDKLTKTHSPTYQYEFVWENWKLK